MRGSCFVLNVTVVLLNMLT